MLTTMRTVAAVVCSVCLLAVTVAPAVAQNARTTVQHPAGLTRMLVDAPALIEVGTSGDDPTFVYQPAGRFQLWTGPNAPTGGNPLISGDEDRPFASVETGTGTWDLTQFTSKLTISVDGEQFDPYLEMFNQDDETNAADLPLFWLTDPVAGARDVVGEVLVPLTTDVPEDDEPNLRLRQNYELVHDGVMLEHIIYNEDTSSHNVGFRVAIDALFGGATRDGTSIILDDGTVLTAETQIPDSNNPNVEMPDSWISHDDPDNPLISVSGTIDGDEVRDAGIASESAGRPDSIAFGQYRNIARNRQFDFQPNPRASLTDEDWAYAVRWDERALQPGQSRRYVTYYGLGAAAVDYDPPYALAAYAPASLQVEEGDDPETPETESFHLVDPDGNSVFEVAAAIDNFGTMPINSANVRISLPPGLELYPETQRFSISMGTIMRNQAPLPIARWTVRADGARPGTAEIEITGPLGKVVRRQISIPAVPIIPGRESELGLEMLSVPYEFVNSDASNVFGSLSDSVHPGGPAALWRYNPERQEYQSYPEPFASNIEPGRGLWLLNQNRETIVLPEDAEEVPDNLAYNVSVSAGWNQIGNPFVVPIRFDRVEVIGPDGTQWSISEAANRGLILPVLYAYDAAQNEYTWETSLQAMDVVPFEGYWLLAYRDVTLVFPPPGLGTAATAATADAPALPDDGWQVGLEVEAAGQTRAPRYLGAASGASDQMDVMDVPAPPALLRAGPELDAWFTIEGAENAPRYLADTRSADTARQTYNLTVLSEAPGAPVTIRWPGLSSSLPDDMVATLEDVAADRRVYMRTSESYTFNSQTGGARQFTITVRPRAEATLGLSATAHAVAGAGLEIAYTLSSDAAVDVEIRNIAGRVVRKLADNRGASEGQNTLMWNGVSEAGTAVPAGTYIVQVTARSPETGEQTSVIRTATLAQ
ncbi:MAG: FlgD immunoglobulin-like domain containing protein [Armatimonadota bacterium]